MMSPIRLLHSVSPVLIGALCLYFVPLSVLSQETAKPGEDAAPSIKATPAIEASPAVQGTPAAETTPATYDRDVCLNRNKALPDYAKLHELVKDRNTPPLTWVITGDSITHGCRHTHGERNYPEHWIELIRWDRGRFNDAIVNTGISGNKITDLLPDFERRVARFDPQIVSINLGMNDQRNGPDKLAGFTKDMRDAIHRVRALNALPILHIPNPVLEEGHEDVVRNLKLYADALRALADEEQVLLVDHETHWNHFAQDPAVRKTWMNDYVHPNGLGHAEMFKKMAYDLGLFDQKILSCTLGDKTLNTSSPKKS